MLYTVEYQSDSGKWRKERFPSKTEAEQRAAELVRTGRLPVHVTETKGATRSDVVAIELALALTFDDETGDGTETQCAYTPKELADLRDTEKNYSPVFYTLYVRHESGEVEMLEDYKTWGEASAHGKWLAGCFVIPFKDCVHAEMRTNP